MKLNDWLTLLAIVLGPISAVVITLYIERRRKITDRRVQIVRMLLATRHMVADAQYSIAVNLIPADFNDQPKVMAAWGKYHDAVRERDKAADPDHQKRLSAAQSTMIYEVMQCAGLKMSEGDIQTQAYVSQGFVDRDTIYIASLQALPVIANTLQRQADLTQRIVDNIPERNQPLVSRDPPRT